MGKPTSSSFVDNRTGARLHRPGEMAQSIAGAFLPAGVCWSGCPLFSTLGYTQALLNYFVCWRMTFSCPIGSYACVCCRRWHAFERRFNESCSFGDELLEGFCGS